MFNSRQKKDFEEYFCKNTSALLLHNFGNIGKESRRTVERSLDKFFGTSQGLTATASKIGEVTKIKSEIIKLLLRTSVEVTYEKYSQDLKSITGETFQLQCWLQKAQSRNKELSGDIARKEKEEKENG
jgi:hypothetical protein